jgi:hypothetical protein
MDLSKGFQIEDPAVFVPWGIGERELLNILPVEPHHVTAGYYVIDCTSLSGSEHALGFHFRSDPSKLSELEFFRRLNPTYPDLRPSFDDFQRHLEVTFGTPSSESSGSEGLPSYRWKISEATIVHYVLDRFGPEEHVRITRA